jgi:hypothetical protein
VTPSVFWGALDALQARQGLDWSRFEFLDLGSGKGRALMLASRMPFARIVGVELVPALSVVAEANLARFSAPWQVCRSLEAREGDATTVALSSAPLVVYVYHSFLPPVLSAVLEHLRRSVEAHPRELVFLYFNPEHEAILADFPFLQKEWGGIVPMAPEDAQADRFGREGEPVAVYRHVPAGA